jgi:hypothetical protein
MMTPLGAMQELSSLRSLFHHSILLIKKMAEKKYRDSNKL